MFMIAIMVVIGIWLVMFRVSCLTVFMRFEHHMHVRIKKKNEIPNQRHCTTEAQPHRFLFSRSHSEPVSSRPALIIGRYLAGASPDFLNTNHQNQIVPRAPHTAAPIKFARGLMLHNHAPRNEPLVTTQSRMR